MKRRISGRTIASAAASMCAIFTSGVNAAEYTATAGGDLAAAATWGGTLPGENDNAYITEPSESYTVSKDIVFGNLRFDGTGSKYRITADGRKIGITTNDVAFYMYSGTSSSKKRTITLKGGCYDFLGKNGTENDFVGMGTGSTLVLDGCVWTNISNFSLSRWSCNNAHLRLANGSGIFNAGQFSFGQKNQYGSVEVSGGSRITGGGWFCVGGSANDGPEYMHNTLKVTGEGSLFKCGGRLDIGYKGGGVSVIVSDDATVECVDLRINDSKGKENRITVTDAKLDVSGYLLFKESTSEKPLCGIAATNSVVSVGALTNRCNGARFDFQNVEFMSAGPVRFMECDRNTTVRFGGAQGTVPGFVKTTEYLFGNSGDRVGNTLIFDDGIAYTNTAYLKYLYRGTSNCTLRVSGGAEFNSGKFFVGHTDYANRCMDNFVEVLDGGVLRINRFYMAGEDNTLVVSNGTVVTEDSFESFFIGYSEDNPMYVPSGAAILVRGSTPKISGTGNFYLREDSVIEIDVPSEGYPEGHVPVECGRLIYDETASLRVDCGDYLAAGGGTVVLMAFRQLPTWEDAAVKFGQWVKAQSEAMPLPPGCRVRYVEADGDRPHRIVLRALPPTGSRIVIR